jgi:hypothetical protein
VVEFLLEQGADPNEVFEGHTIWEYFIHYIYTPDNPELLFAPAGPRSRLRKILKGLLETFMKSGADLDICCIEDDRIWDRVFDHDPFEHPGARIGWVPHTENVLFAHVGPSTKRFKRVARTDSGSTPSTFSTESPSTTDQSEVSDSDEGSMDDNENLSFQDRHSLAAVIKDLFATEGDPHGADELLELMATLKAAKNLSEDKQS